MPEPISIDLCDKITYATPDGRVTIEVSHANGGVIITPEGCFWYPEGGRRRIFIPMHRAWSVITDRRAAL